jgi:hypothetical protein
MVERLDIDVEYIIERPTLTHPSALSHLPAGTGSRDGRRASTDPSVGQ